MPQLESTNRTPTISISEAGRDMTDYLWVRRQQNGTVGKVRLDGFRDRHWSGIAGGRGRPTPGYFIFGYISCDAVLEGEVGHTGSHGPCPHRIKVCVTRKGNDPAIYDMLVAVVGPKPRFVTNAERALEAIAAAGPDGIRRQDLIWRAHLRGNYGFAPLQRLIDKGQVTLTSETRPNSDGKPQPQHVYRLADQSP